MHAEEEWTEPMRRGTTTARQQSQSFYWYTRMLAAPSRDRSVFPQIFADHWEAFQHAHPRYQRPYYDGWWARCSRVAIRAKIGYIEYRCLHCGQGKHRWR